MALAKAAAPVPVAARATAARLAPLTRKRLAAAAAGRHGITDLFAALNIATGQVLHQTRPRHRPIEFRRFLDAIDAAVPQDLDVHVILDNLFTHKTPAINTWLLRHPRFSFHFTPTSSSWLNLVERCAG